MQGEQVPEEGDFPAHERGGEPLPRHTPALLQVHQGEVRQRENRLEFHIHFLLYIFLLQVFILLHMSPRKRQIG
jgi:hypothetical protein